MYCGEFKCPGKVIKTEEARLFIVNCVFVVVSK